MTAIIKRVITKSRAWLIKNCRCGLCGWFGDRVWRCPEIEASWAHAQAARKKRK